MKKLEIVKSEPRVLNLGVEDEVNEVITPTIATISNVKSDVPPKILFGDYNLKGLKSFKKIRKGYKLKNLKHSFVNDLSIVLVEYSPDNLDNQLNDELLLELLNVAEAYFFYPKNKDDRNAIKKECVVELMLPYFRNDLQLLNKTIELLQHKVKKSSLMKRLYQRAKNVFSV